MPARDPATFSFRPATFTSDGGDLPFLCALYAGTRQEEMAQSGWPQKEIDAFLAQQFEAQHAHYMEHFAGANFDIILDGDGRPTGRLYLEERDDEFRIIDIALVPEFRGKGTGGKILQDIIGKASAVGKAVRIHVEQNNPAMRLYRRLGFRMVEEQGVYHLMEWVPELVGTT